MKTLVRNGRVVLDGSVQSLDVLIEGERIAALGALAAGSADQVIDARGCYVLPGLIDFHTHLDDRIGPYCLADGYASGTRMALENGITTLCTFVTQGASETLLQALTTVWAKAAGRNHCDVLWHLTPTTFSPGDLATLQTLAAGGYRTLKFYTTYKDAGICSTYEHLESLFRSLSPQGSLFLVHCEDNACIDAVDTAELDLSKALTHTLLRPEVAEVLAIRRVVELVIAHQQPCTWCTSPPWRGRSTWWRTGTGATSAARPAPSTFSWTRPGWPGRTAIAGSAPRPCGGIACPSGT